MARALLMALVALFLVEGCSPSAEAVEQQQAVEVFAAFQSALFAGDRNTIRKLLTRKSKQFTDAVLSRPLDGRQPLEVVGTSKVRNQLRVHVKDPNEHDQRTFFVLVKEDGRVLVDPVATTAYNSEQHRLPGPREIVRQKRLTPREIERIRAVTKQAIR